MLLFPNVCGFLLMMLRSSKSFGSKYTRDVYTTINCSRWNWGGPCQYLSHGRTVLGSCRIMPLQINEIHIFLEKKQVKREKKERCSNKDWELGKVAERFVLHSHHISMLMMFSPFQSNLLQIRYIISKISTIYPTR